MEVRRAVATRCNLSFVPVLYPLSPTLTTLSAPPPRGVLCSSVDADTRSLVRRRLSDERRRLAGLPADVDVAELFQANQGGKAIGPLAWEAANGDGLLALALALDVLEMKKAAEQLVA